MLDELKPEPDHEIDDSADVLDLIMKQREDMNAALGSDGEQGMDEAAKYPPELMRRL